MANLGQLRTRQRYLVDEPSAKFWEDVELNWYLNIAYSIYYEELVNAGYSKLESAPATLNITAGTETVALPSDYFLWAMLELVKDNKTIPLTYQPRYEAINLTSGSDTSDYEPTWYIRGSNIVLEPTPGASVTGGLKFHYYPSLTELSSDSDTPVIDAIFHHLIAVKGAIIAKEGRQEAVTTELNQLLDKLEKPFWSLIKNLVKSRQYTTPYMTTEEDI